MLCQGSAAICLLSEHMTVVRQRIDTNVPRKRKGGTSGHDKVSLSAFYYPVDGDLYLGNGEFLSKRLPGNLAINTVPNIKSHRHCLSGFHQGISTSPRFINMMIEGH
jgi:hypothetical protein